MKRIWMTTALTLAILGAAAGGAVHAFVDRTCSQCSETLLFECDCGTGCVEAISCQACCLQQVVNTLQALPDGEVVYVDVMWVGTACIYSCG